jgi:restriction system-associated AAA family ATPase
MKLLKVEVISAITCGGLLDDFTIHMKSLQDSNLAFNPLCLIGANGAGKSQFLQVLAEMFQSAFHACLPEQERREGNPTLQFSLEYAISTDGQASHVRISRRTESKRLKLRIERKKGPEWIDCPIGDPLTAQLLPAKIVGYTSGDNETLSLPFLISRSGYADEVRNRALSETDEDKETPDTRLMLVDYGTHLEVLVANLLLGEDEQRTAILHDARLNDLHSFRCIIQLAHGAINRAPKRKAKAGRKGVQLTQELETYIDHLVKCSTCHTYDPKSETYVLDFRIGNPTKQAFSAYFSGPLDLYGALHKLAMLNDLAIPKAARERFKRDTNSRLFASRLPEPQDEDKVFRFERVTFTGNKTGSSVEYVSLSDGEHQLVQLLGTFCMFSFRNVLFLLDEPESHFNPQWRVKFLSRINDLPTKGGLRSDQGSDVALQECLLTTHSPFVPSDMRRENVIIFQKEGEKLATHRPDIETYGTTFDSILEECFQVRPPISEIPKAEMIDLMASTDVAKIKAGLARLGASVEKVYLEDHLKTLSAGKGA